MAGRLGEAARRLDPPLGQPWMQGMTPKERGWVQDADGWKQGPRPEGFDAAQKNWEENHYSDGSIRATMAPQGDNAPDHVESILVEADRTAGASGRSVEYGHPIEDFTRTGRMWAAILGVDEVTPEQVGLCMVAVKVSRECNAHKRDNLVDGAGYFKCVELIKERQAEDG